MAEREWLRPWNSVSFKSSSRMRPLKLSKEQVDAVNAREVSLPSRCCTSHLKSPPRGGDRCSGRIEAQADLLFSAIKTTPDITLTELHPWLLSPPPDHVKKDCACLRASPRRRKSCPGSLVWASTWPWSRATDLYRWDSNKHQDDAVARSEPVWRTVSRPHSPWTLEDHSLGDWLALERAHSSSIRSKFPTTYLNPQRL